MPYKWCFVQYCRNTTTRTPSKRFVAVPKDPARRKKWFEAIKREPEYERRKNSSLTCCEDHFDFKIDMENYLRYEMMGGPILLKKGVVPHIFDRPKPGDSTAKQRNLEESVYERLSTNGVIESKIEVGEQSIVDNNIKEEIHIKKELEEFDVDPFNVEFALTNIKEECGNSSSLSACEDSNLEVKIESEEQIEAVNENTNINISNFINKIKEEIKVKTEETSSNSNNETVIKEEIEETSSNNENDTSETSTDNETLKKHQNIRIRGIKYLCNICKKTFSQSSSLSRHMAIHGTEKYECNMCEKSFSLMSYLKRHRLHHTGEGKYQCNYCEKRFTQSSSLKNHLEIHVGEKKYHCKFCKKSFTLKDYMNRHLIIHNNEAKYRCTIKTNSPADVGNLKGKINYAFKKILHK
ncbi:unnamed protein product [Phyllotreta striolata]|uniref:Uncharacterized protein n=1 Tax=Phyllotreta striolata TaxID=444603 RepID=A0A9N9XQB0_PHYSR|nr:unnamed protein product [Phyllotreta striolata]